MDPPLERFYVFGPFRLDTAEHTLRRDGQPVPLTPKAFDTLLALVRRPGKLVTKERLIQEVWPGVAVTENNLNQSVSAVRKALGQAGESAQYIETIPRRGYRFVATVRTERTSSPQLPVMASPPKRSRRVPVAVVAVATATLLGAGAYRAFRGSRAVAEPPRVQRLTSSGQDSSPAASRDGGMVAFASARQGRRRIWVKHLADGTEVAVTSGTDDRPRFSPDATRIAFIKDEGARRSLYRVSVVGGEERKVVEEAIDADWSPDGRSIAFLRMVDGQPPHSVLAIVPAEGGQAREVARVPGGGLDSPRWSPDGASIAVRRAGGSTGIPDAILLVAADGGGWRALPLPGPAGRISSPAWSGGTGEIVYAQSEALSSTRAAVSARIVALDPRDGRHRTLFWLAESVHAVDVAGDGRLVFDAHSTREGLHELALPAATEPRILTQGQSNDRQPVYSPDGEWIVFSSDKSRNLDLWRVSTRDGSAHRLTDDAADDWDPAVTRDGRTLLWSSNRSGPFEVWIANADGSGARQLTRDGVDAENPTATPDGEWIVYSSAHPAQAGIWKIRRDGSSPVRLVAGEAVWPEASPDGRFAAYRSAAYDWPNARLAQVSVRVVRLEDGAEVPFEIRVKEGLSAGRSRWMPDGRAIAFVAPDEAGVNGVFVQDFAPGRDTTATRRRLAGFDRTAMTESFGLSPDGARITIAARQAVSMLMMAEGVPRLGRRR